MQMEYVDEKELDMMMCLQNLIEIHDDIKNFCQNNYPYHNNVRGFLCFYKNKIDKKRQERRKEIDRKDRKRAIREKNEIEIIKHFIGTHEPPNMAQGVKEHFLRYEKEEEIQRREDENERCIKKKENENLRKILGEKKNSKR